MPALPGNTFNFQNLRIGDSIEVAFGSKGTQRAVVKKVTKDGNVYVSKYRAKSDSWTKPVRLYPSELLKLFI